jgi:ferritin-like metal-binding protein YciE
MEPKDILISWLNDAYAMENSIAQTLEQHLDDAKNEKEISEKIQEHLNKTKMHAQEMHKAITRLGGSVSEVKSGVASIMGVIQGASTGLAPDRIVKNALAEYSAEYFEMACYKALIAAAEEIGDQETVNVAKDIIKEEEEMAAWLEAQLPEVVAEYLRREKTQ